MLSALIVYPVALCVAVFVGWRAAARGLSAAQVAARIILVLYLGWLVGATLFPLPLTGHLAASELGPAERLLDQYNAPNLVPLRAIRETAALGWGWPAVRLLAGNVFVFVPFGLLLPVIWPRPHRFWRLAFAGLALSASIELGQLAGSLSLGYWYRMSDVDDLLLNVAGVLLGYGLFTLLRALWRRDAAGAAGRRRAVRRVD
jgi:glycopeptide antibiotics resistance protein